MKKVSIIIPIFNVEKYLTTCLDSIVNQTYKNFEVILIDDGSTDASGDICDRYKQNNENFIVIHQKNSGVSCARNRGIDISSGEYLLFVDADDFIDNNALEKLINSVDNYDMIIYGYNEKFLDREILHNVTPKKHELKNIEAVNYIFDNKRFGGYLWNKLFINKKIKDNNLKFNENIYMCEDMLFIEKYLMVSKNILLFDECLYHYRMRKTSAVWNKNEKYMSMFEVYKNIYEDFVKNNVNMNKFNYSLLSELFKLTKKQQDEVIEKFNININQIFADIMKNKENSLKDKLKLIILKKFKIIYKCYMKKKIKALYE